MIKDLLLEQWEDWKKENQRRKNKMTSITKTDVKKGIRTKEQKEEEYNYSEDINWNDCEHKRTTPFDIKPEWQEDIVSIIIECKDCTRVGHVDGTIDYNEEEVQW